MITRITGKLLGLDDERAILGIDAFDYQVFIPDFVRRQLQSRLGEQISLYTIQYLEGNPTQGRLTPRLVGFSSEIEREFFEMFCSVDGVGVKKALRSMVRPVRDVATMIVEQDVKGLSTLPGIGGAMAERIVAKLRRKMSKFALMVAHEDVAADGAEYDVVRDAYDALCKLGHTEADARKMIETVLATKKRYSDVETLLHAVYEQNIGR